MAKAIILRRLCVPGNDFGTYYRMAYYQRRINQVLGFCLVIFAMGLSFIGILSGPDQSDFWGLLILLIALPLPYALYCLGRLSFYLFGWWSVPALAVSVVLYPLLIPGILLVYWELQGRYQFADIPANWLGVGGAWVNELKAREKGDERPEEFEEWQNQQLRDSLKASPNAS